ncbi:MAG: aldehyde dehydrogenase family protein, partial [Acidobacteria bacterium]|nr:aldehyde dehydrogenase family protein [Acidobacteriota bacterium]
MPTDQLRNYIAGTWIAAEATEFADVLNPATSELLASAPLSGAREVGEAVDAASSAFTSWRRLPAND